MGVDGQRPSIRVAEEHQERDVADDRVGDEGPQDPAPRDGFLLLVHASTDLPTGNNPAPLPSSRSNSWTPLGFDGPQPCPPAFKAEAEAVCWRGTVHLKGFEHETLVLGVDDANALAMDQGIGHLRGVAQGQAEEHDVALGRRNHRLKPPRADVAHWRLSIGHAWNGLVHLHAVGVVIVHEEKVRLIGPVTEVDPREGILTVGAAVVPIGDAGSILNLEGIKGQVAHASVKQAKVGGVEVLGQSPQQTQGRHQPLCVIVDIIEHVVQGAPHQLLAVLGLLGGHPGDQQGGAVGAANGGLDPVLVHVLW